MAALGGFGEWQSVLPTYLAAVALVLLPLAVFRRWLSQTAAIGRLPRAPPAS